MSDQHELSARISAETTDFKTQIATLNREIRVLETGFRASAAGLGDWTKDASGLESRMKTLNGEIDLQQRKVDALQGEYQRVAAEKGETSRAAQELQIKLNRENETLGKLETELRTTQGSLDGMGEESQDASKQVDELGNKEDDTRKKTLDLSGAVGGLKEGLKVGITAIAGLAAAVAGAGLAIGKMVLDATDAAGELVDMSLKTGISTERLQELAYVGEQVGTDLDTMTGSLSKLTKNMDAAKDSGSEIGKTFAELGVPVVDANGALRDSEEVFGDVLNALGGMENETERDAASLAIFGKSAMELNPLIKAGADEIGRLSEEARDMGAVMSEENVAGLEEFGDSLAGLEAGLKGTLGTMVTAFLPGFKGIVGGLQGYLAQFSSIVSGSDGDIGKMATGMGGLIGQIVTDIASKAPELLQAGLGIVQGIMDAIIQALPVMIPAVINMLSMLVQFIVQNLPILIDAAIQVVLMLVNGLVTQLPMLIEAAIQMIIALANGLAQAIPKLIPVIAEIIPTIIITLIENLPLLIDAALELILAIVDGLIQALPVLIEYAPQIITALIEALLTALPQIGEAAMELIIALVNGLLENLPKIVTAAGDIIESLYVGAMDLTWKIMEIGYNIVIGVWQGIEEKVKWFTDNVIKFFTGIVDSVKTALHIKSPSMVFAEIGENMALGLGVGFGDAFASVSRDIGRTVGGLAPSINVSGAASGYGGYAAQPIMINAPISGVTILSELDLRRVAYMVVEEMQRGGI